MSQKGGKKGDDKLKDCILQLHREIEHAENSIAEAKEIHGEIADITAEMAYIRDCLMLINLRQATNPDKPGQ